MKSWILNVGDEVLSGKVTNTSAAYLADKLNSIGIETVKNVVVADDEGAIENEVKDFLKSKAELLITTGGLGPTHDDFTKEVVSKTLGLDLVLYEEAAEHINNYFQTVKSDCNLKQAYFPKNSILIPNKRGTAYGAIFKRDAKTFIILVGPPSEMKPMFDEYVYPYLKNNYGCNSLSINYHVMGEGESFFEEYQRELYSKYKDKVSLAPYVALGMIRYELKSSLENEKYFLMAKQEFETLMGKYIISDSGEVIEEVVVKLLKEAGYKISFCESCTGGLLTSKIIGVPGASSVIDESIITYANLSKVKHLKVNQQTIANHGVVSDQTVEEMVRGLFEMSGSDVSIAISGIAGPDNGTTQKPVGLVHYAIKINERIYVEHNIFKGDRNMIREKAAKYILYKTYVYLKENLIHNSKYSNK